MFAVGLMDCAAFSRSEDAQRRGREEKDNNHAQERESEDDVPRLRRHSMDMGRKGRPAGIPTESEPAAGSLNAVGESTTRLPVLGLPSVEEEEGGVHNTFFYFHIKCLCCTTVSCFVLCAYVVGLWGLLNAPNIDNQRLQTSNR